MAQTFAEALAEIELAAGADFDAAVGYAIPTPRRTPPDAEVAAAFADFDYERIREIVRMLGSRYGVHDAHVEDAVHDALLQLLDRRPDLFKEDPATWAGLLYKATRFNLVGQRRQASRLASIDALLGESGGGDVLAKARSCVPPSPGDEDDIERQRTPPPADGEAWNREQIIGSFQRFRDRTGRPPTSKDLCAANRLPGKRTVQRQFGSFVNAVLASGMMPLRGTPRKWSPLSVARACADFRRREGFWPEAMDAEYDETLPQATIIRRLLGGSRQFEIERGSKAVLATL